MTKAIAEKYLQYNRESLSRLRGQVKSSEESMSRSKKTYEQNADSYDRELTELRQLQSWVNYLEQQIEQLPE